MGFWGLSRRGRDARNNFDEASRWLFDRGQNAFERGDTQYGRGDWLQDWLSSQYGQFYDQGFGTPDQVNQAGREAMPWLDGIIGDRNARTAQMGANNEATIAGRFGELDHIGQNIGRHYQAIGGDINDWGSRASGRDQDYSDSIQGDISGQFGAFDTNASGTYGDLLSGAETAFGQSMDLVRPGGEARAATAARAFAPNIARTHQRLRRAGIDPASVEGQSLLQNVEAQRARAMDDSLGDANNRLSQMILDRFDTQSGLRRDQLANQQFLGLNRLDRTTDERRRNLDAQQGIDRQRTTDSIDNSRRGYGDTQNFYQQRMDELGYGNDLRNAHLGYLNDQDLTHNDLMLQRYGVGRESIGDNYNVRQDALGGMGRIMDTSYNQGNFQDQFGLGAMGTAQGGFGQQLARADQNAGWGARLLGGIGGTLLGGLAGGGGAPFGGFGTPPFNPSASTQFNPNASPARANAWAGWGDHFSPRQGGLMSNRQPKPSGPDPKAARRAVNQQGYQSFDPRRYGYQNQRMRVA